MSASHILWKFEISPALELRDVSLKVTSRGFAGVFIEFFILTLTP